MAVDEGVRDAILTDLREQAERYRSLWRHLQTRLERALVEDRAQQSLTPEQQILLRDAGLLDKEDVTMIQAEAQKMRELFEALQALIQALRGLR